MGGLALTDDDASIKRVDDATAPILATLDEVIAKGDSSEQLVAAYTKGDLLLGLQERLREAIPPMTSRTSLQAAKDLERRHQVLEPKLQRWGKEGTAAFLRVMEAARANPELTSKNPVIQYMVRDAERRTG